MTLLGKSPEENGTRQRQLPGDLVRGGADRLTWGCQVLASAMICAQVFQKWTSPYQ